MREDTVMVEYRNRPDHSPTRWPLWVPFVRQPLMRGLYASGLSVRGPFGRGL